MADPNNSSLVPEDLEPKVYTYLKRKSDDPDTNDQVVMFQAADVSGGGSFGETDTNGLVVASLNYLFNGTDFSAEESNRNTTILASAARTSTTSSGTQTNRSNNGAHFLFNVTAVPGGDTVTPRIQGREPVSGDFYDILVGPAISATGLTVLKIYPGIAALANGAANDILPLQYRVSVTHSGAGSFTYSFAESRIR